MASHIEEFLAELVQANRSVHTVRAYAADLRSFTGNFTVVTLREYFAQFAALAPSTRARKQAAFSAYCQWAVRQGLLGDNPVARLERVRLEPPPPRAITRVQFGMILACSDSPRDRLLYRLLFELGLRISEALGIYVEDLAMTRDDEHVTVKGKGGRHRTLLLDDPKLVRELRIYLRQTGYTRGLMFRAEKNGTGGPLRYQSIQARWARACVEAGVTATLHQCRHAHATELINGGAHGAIPVSLATIRKRLGHRHIASTLRYAELSDKAAEAEIRAWRRGL